MAREFCFSGGKGGVFLSTRDFTFLRLSPQMASRERIAESTKKPRHCITHSSQKHRNIDGGRSLSNQRRGRATSSTRSSYSTPVSYDKDEILSSFAIKLLFRSVHLMPSGFRVHPARKPRDLYCHSSHVGRANIR